MDALIITLGHNSSAIYVQDGNIVSGYEEERLSEIKSDSAFPSKAIKKITDNGPDKFDMIYVGHWFVMGEFINSKYGQKDYLLKLLKSGSERDIVSVSPKVSHHDTHMASAYAFAGQYGFDLNSEGSAILVADGFGTFSEAISLYKYSDKLEDFTSVGPMATDGYPIHKRHFGFQNSLGLLYQYSTAFQKMKMHNHEYKMLGYEAHIYELELDQIEKIDYCIGEAVDSRLKELQKIRVNNEMDPIVNVEALQEVRESVYNELTNMLKFCEVPNETDDDLYHVRIACSYYTQNVVEGVILEYVKQNNIKKLVVVGGLFYNVKLNNNLSKIVESFCAMPLAGDQGAGLGLYHIYNRNLKFPKFLDWGVRYDKASDYAKFNLENNGSKIHVTTSREKALSIVIENIEKYGFVNFVDKSMEFGPRALGFTSTIALPTSQMCQLINQLNNRTDVMPMAPFMLQSQLEERCKGKLNIVGSLEYMITAVDLDADKCSDMPGASHKYLHPISGEVVYTCRPQIVDSNKFLYVLCKKFGPLINTSFNYHGVPIVYNCEQVVKSHDYQVSNAPEGVNVNTVVLVEA